MLLDGKTTTLLRKKLVRLFSPPLTPTFGERREDNRIRLRLRHTWKGYMSVLPDGFAPMHLQSPCQ